MARSLPIPPLSIALFAVRQALLPLLQGVRRSAAEPESPESGVLAPEPSAGMGHAQPA